MALLPLYSRLLRAPSKFPLRQTRLPPTLPLPIPGRTYSTTTDSVQAPDYLSEGERKVFSLIKEKLQPSALTVEDISGGCGSMYGIDIVSAKFHGMPVIKQHRLVNEILGDEIKKWHGVQLKTKAP